MEGAWLIKEMTWKKKQRLVSSSVTVTGGAQAGNASDHYVIEKAHVADTRRWTLKLLGIPLAMGALVGMLNMW